MKILLLDVDSCYFCPCSSAEIGWLGNITRSVCQVKGEENTVYMDAVSGVPNWCPLKPLPQKKEPSVQLSVRHNDEPMETLGFRCTDYEKGWNACLEEIQK